MASILVPGKWYPIRNFLFTVFVFAGFILQGCSPDAQPGVNTITGGSEAVDSIPVQREMRGAWIATVANMDWPSEPGLPVERQQEELIAMLDRAAAMNLNSVIFQIRPATDALYDSPYEPWSVYLTGEMGKAPDPYYDPLEFAIKEAHKRGLELHAWLNPYRAQHPSDEAEPSSGHVSNTHPDYVLEYGDYLWMDPGLPEVQDLSHKVIMDVVERYDIDGIHMDDYYYPYRTSDDFPDTTSWRRAQEQGNTLSRGDWRRQNVNQFIERLYTDIKEVKSHVKFGISPIGYWYPGHPSGTFGFDAYEQIYADSRLWLREGWLDIFIPQLYTETALIARPFPEMLQWWEEQNWQDRHVYAGLIPSRVRRQWEPEEILTQVYIARGQQGVTGSVHFRMEDFLTNPRDLTGLITSSAYAEPALIPTAPWLGSTPPDAPEASLEESDNELVIQLRPSEEDRVRWWVVRSRTDKNYTDSRYTEEDNYWEVDIIPGFEETIVFGGSEGTVWPDEILISAVDRLGNESSGKKLVMPRGGDESSEATTEAPEITRRSSWGPEPAGQFANATRRNLTEGDTLGFRDLKMVFRGTGSSEDVAHITLSRYSVEEELIIPEGRAFNWSGYHIGVLEVDRQNEGSDRPYTEVEIATVTSLAIPRMLSLPRASLQETGGAAQRLWVPHSVTDITLHASAASDGDFEEHLNDLYTLSLEDQNYWDLPYHYVVGPDGTIYEGRDRRYAGESQSGFDPQGHLIISVAGDGNLEELSPDQNEAVVQLVNWLAGEYEVEPNGIHRGGEWVGNPVNSRGD